MGFSPFFMSFLKNFTDFSLFQKNMKVYLNRKRSFIWYNNISSSIIFSRYHKRMQILNEDVKINDNFDFKWLSSPKTKPKIGLPRFFFNFKVYLIEKSWGAFVSKNVRLLSKNGLWPTD